MSLKEALKKRMKGISKGDDLHYLETLPTGIASLDAAIGGGLPLRRVIQIYGPESVGKSALALNIIRHVQQQDKEAEAFYVDCEGTVTKGDIEDLHLDGERIMFYSPQGGEEAYDSALDALEAGARIAIIDSVPFLRPKKVLDEIDKNSEYRDVSSIALLMERVQNKIVHTLQRSNGCLIFINQQRPSKGQYIAPTYPGGSALSFMLSLNLQIYSAPKDKNDPTYMTQNIISTKNKTFVPLQRAEVHLHRRIPEYERCLIDAALKTDLVTMKAGGHYYVDEALAPELGLSGNKLGHGINQAAETIKQNPEVYQKLYRRVIEESIKRPQCEELEIISAASIYE